MASLKKLLEKANMQSMKKTPQAKDKMAVDSPCCEPYDEDKYPYGLRIDLNTESLEKLGLSAADFTAGGEVTIKASCDVISVRSEQRQKKSHESVDLQITELAVVKEGK
jgi:hypothetical protein